MVDKLQLLWKLASTTDASTAQHQRSRELLIRVSLLKVPLHCIIHYSFCLDLVCVGELCSDIYLTLNGIIFNIVHMVPLDLLLPWERGWFVSETRY